MDDSTSAAMLLSAPKLRSKQHMTPRLQRRALEYAIVRWSLFVEVSGDHLLVMAVSQTLEVGRGCSVPTSTHCSNNRHH